MGFGYDIAETAVILLEAGHRWKDVRRMTLRQMGAWRELIERQRIGQRAQQLAMMRAAFVGDKSAFAKYLKRLADQS